MDQVNGIREVAADATMSLEIQPREEAEVQIGPCRYAQLLRCKARNCFTPGTVIARYLDASGIFVSQFETVRTPLQSG